jgi:hypothetical protein
MQLLGRRALFKGSASANADGVDGAIGIARDFCAMGMRKLCEVFHRIRRKQGGKQDLAELGEFAGNSDCF